MYVVQYMVASVSPVLQAILNLSGADRAPKGLVVMHERRLEFSKGIV